LLKALSPTWNAAGPSPASGDAAEHSGYVALPLAEKRGLLPEDNDALRVL